MSIPTDHESDLASELDDLTAKIREAAKRVKRTKNMSAWGAVDDASDFTEYGAKLLRGEIEMESAE